MKFTPIQVISIIAIFQSFFLFLHFARLKKGDKLINIILSIFLACFAFLMLAALSVTAGVEQYFIKYHKAIFLIRQIAFLIGPLLYFFIRRSVNTNYQPQRREIFHFLPFVISLCYYSFKLPPIPQFIIWQSDLRVINSLLIFSHNLIYVFMSIFKLKQKQFILKPSINGSGNSKLSWLLLVICGTVIVWLIELNSLFILHILKYFKYCHNMTSLYSASTFIFLNSIAYFVLTRPDLFSFNKKYEKSRLKASEKKAYQKKLIEYMEKEKPYFNPLLSMTDLENALLIPRRELSQIINETFQQHFYDFVNFYRIEESKQFLKESSNGNKTILEIGYSVGFNSKSAFNTAFKKHTGITPTKFRNNK